MESLRGWIKGPQVARFPEAQLDADINSLISIESVTAAEALRVRLNQFFWESDETPRDILPVRLSESVTDTRYEDLLAGPARQIEELVVKLDFGIESRVYVFLPARPTSNFVLFHAGHEGDFVIYKKQISALLDHGHTVAALCMPLTGLNNQPVVHIPKVGPLKMVNHDRLKFLSPDKGHAVKYLLQPAVAVLNYATSRLSNAKISMIGISGGGWTTTLMAAIDPRIQISFPVAGSLPLHLRGQQGDWGDWEQSLPEIFKMANYLDLYVLGGWGKNRVQCQVCNFFDPVCFGGDRLNIYSDAVKARVELLGSGTWTGFLDSTQELHTISPATMQRFIAAIEAANPAQVTSGAADELDSPE